VYAGSGAHLFHLYPCLIDCVAAIGSGYHDTVGILLKECLFRVGRDLGLNGC